ncbi:MAG: hypothetical protein V4692_03590, partial [Bdellovibrionota bacterium]
VMTVMKSCVSAQRLPTNKDFNLDFADAVGNSEQVGECIGKKLEGKFERVGSPDCDVRQSE